jgi:hypothetical protein
MRRWHSSHKHNIRQPGTYSVPATPTKRMVLAKQAEHAKFLCLYSSPIRNLKKALNYQTQNGRKSPDTTHKLKNLDLQGYMQAYILSPHCSRPGLPLNFQTPKIGLKSASHTTTIKTTPTAYITNSHLPESQSRHKVNTPSTSYQLPILSSIR